MDRVRERSTKAGGTPSMITAAAIEHAPGAMPDATAGELTAAFNRVHRNRRGCVYRA